MRFDLLQEHLNRRKMLGVMGKAGAVGAVTASGLALPVGATTGRGATPEQETPGRLTPAHRYDDELDIEGALSGRWAEETSLLYGPDDQRGTLNEITPEKTARALALLAGADQVHSYNLGHVMRNGFPAYETFPERVYSQRIVLSGAMPENPEEWFTAETMDEAGYAEWRRQDLEHGPLGYLGGTEPFGTNLVTGAEERFLHGGTYQIGTQFDNFNHFGFNGVFYNGFKASEIATPTGFTKLGMEQVGSFATRGVLIDVLGWKKAQRGGEDVQTVNGHDMLTDHYRITIEDLLHTLRWQGVDQLLAGDAILIRTGWWWLAEDPDTHDRYLASEPGIYVAEAKFLADFRPALIGSDAWALEVVGNPELTEYAFPVHSELLVHRGIHIGESIITHELAEKGIYRFVYTYSPQRAWGATAGNAPPMALATR